MAVIPANIGMYHSNIIAIRMSYIELMSDSTDLGEKKDLYEQVFQTHEYFVFEPKNSHSLQGWRLKITVINP
ncbi:conserved hypothetical protein [Beggiatoa sp. PS]|nr:conserved hypothetical protein [Beggiatoa sp. PS]